MTKEELIKRLETTCYGLDPIDPLRLLVDDVIAALAQTEQDHIPDARNMVTEQEPVAYWKEHAQGLQRDYDLLLADFQAQRTWVDLTDEEIDNINYTSAHMLARAIEARLKELNT